MASPVLDHFLQERTKFRDVPATLTTMGQLCLDERFLGVVELWVVIGSGGLGKIL